VPSLFETHPVSLEYLFQRIHNRGTALPDFQRDFVWEPKATEELIESICRNLPAGSLLQIISRARSRTSRGGILVGVFDGMTGR